MDVAVGPRGNSFITLFEPLRLCSQPNKQRTDGGGDDVRYLQHGRHMATTKKNQLLLVSSTSRPNLLCFGFDLTQSQSSKTISRNGYGPHWNRTNFNWRDQETDMVPERGNALHTSNAIHTLLQNAIRRKAKERRLKEIRRETSVKQGERGETIYLLLQPLKFLFYFLFFVSFSALGKQNLENRIWAFFITLW